ncbi:unnamed protein product [Amoebophrya sp. A25]|nr:unnamed protein product [Amoebophrya sp. A25]|eukprot:GSA25T00026647001.1
MSLSDATGKNTNAHEINAHEKKIRINIEVQNMLSGDVLALDDMPLEDASIYDLKWMIAYALSVSPEHKGPFIPASLIHVGMKDVQEASEEEAGNNGSVPSGSEEHLQDQDVTTKMEQLELTVTERVEAFVDGAKSVSLKSFLGLKEDEQCCQAPESKDESGGKGGNCSKEVPRHKITYLVKSPLNQFSLKTLPAAKEAIFDLRDAVENFYCGWNWESNCWCCSWDSYKLDQDDWHCWCCWDSWASAVSLCRHMHLAQHDDADLVTEVLHQLLANAEDVRTTWEEWRAILEDLAWTCKVRPVLKMVMTLFPDAREELADLFVGTGVTASEIKMALLYRKEADVAEILKHMGVATVQRIAEEELAEVSTRIPEDEGEGPGLQGRRRHSFMLV